MKLFKSIQCLSIVCIGKRSALAGALLGSGINKHLLHGLRSGLSGVFAAFFLLLFITEGSAQEKAVTGDSSSIPETPLEQTVGPAQGDSLSQISEIPLQEPAVENKTVGPQGASLKEVSDNNDGLTNIAEGNKKIRAYGWGEYRIGGRCLCCDNRNDGDCIIVHNIERTDRVRIPQILDGKIEADTGDASSYFGDLRKRDLPEHVSYLMIEIALGKIYEIRKVIVHTMIDHEKRKNYLSNCELGYYDQFNRLQWTGIEKSNMYSEPLVFILKNPILTKTVMLRVKGGKSRIVEAVLLGEGGSYEKP